MRPSLKWTLRVLVALLLIAAAGAVWKWEDLQRLAAVNSLFAEDRIVRNFSSMDRLFFHAPIPMGEALPTSLPVNPRPLPDLSGWLEERAVTGIVVLKDGEIAWEGYFRGTSHADRRISWSVAKSFLSALFGILVEDGAIGDLDAHVTRYVPELAGTAYDGVPIRAVLRMASGVRFDEDYFDFHSDINRMGRVLALGGSLDAFTAGLSERDRAPGEAWAYVSIDTHVLGMVIRRATGRSVIDLMGERLLQPLGLESEPYYVTDRHGVAFVLGGLNMRTRDYARFGQLFLQEGVWNGEVVVPPSWVAESTSPSAPTAEGDIRYGYQWWVPEDGRPGEFLARGVYGQFIYVDRATGVVIAMNSADREFRAPGAFEQVLEGFRTIAEALDGV